MTVFSVFGLWKWEPCKLKNSAKNAFKQTNKHRIHHLYNYNLQNNTIQSILLRKISRNKAIFPIFLEFSRNWHILAMVSGNVFSSIKAVTENALFNLALFVSSKLKNEWRWLLMPYHQEFWKWVQAPWLDLAAEDQRSSIKEDAPAYLEDRQKMLLAKLPDVSKGSISISFPVYKPIDGRTGTWKHTWRDLPGHLFF